MPDALLGEIRLFSFGFAPPNWAPCDGRTLDVQGHAPLFAILGSNYGGDGVTNFALPDLRGAIPVQAGAGPGLTRYRLGEKGGASSVSLDTAHTPPHGHNLLATTANADLADPAGAAYALPRSGKNADARAYATGAPTVAMDPATLAPSGQGAAHPNLMPYLTLNFCICVDGEYPDHG